MSKVIIPCHHCKTVRRASQIVWDDHGFRFHLCLPHTKQMVRLYPNVFTYAPLSGNNV